MKSIEFLNRFCATKVDKRKCRKHWYSCFVPLSKSLSFHISYVAFRAPPTASIEFEWPLYSDVDRSLTVDSVFDESKNLFKIKNDIRDAIEIDLKSKNILVQLSARKIEESGKGLQSGADVLVLTGLDFSFFDPMKKVWVGINDDLLFNSMLPPVVIVCLKYSAKETGKIISAFVQPPPLQ